MSGVPDVHEVLRWANRSEVAREITRRGYRVSLETLNRWHRQRKEVPAAVEHIVFDMFGISGQQETPPPWAEAMQSQVIEALERNRQLIEALALPADIQEAAARVIERLEALEPPGDVAPNGIGGSAGQGALARRDRELG